MEFDWWTFLLQVVNFLILVWLLQRFLYKPINAAIMRRQEEVNLASDTTLLAQKYAHETNEFYSEKVSDLTRQSDEIMDRARQTATEEQQEILTHARDEAADLLVRARDKIDAERREALLDLKSQATDIAVELAKVVLNNAAPQATNDAFLDRAIDYLEAMTPSERAALKNQLDSEHSLYIMTALPLDNAEQTKWRNRLLGLLSVQTNIEFSQDDELIAGVEIHFPHSILRFNWQDTLNGLQRNLRQHADTD